MGPGILPETTVGKHNPPCHLQMPTKTLSCKKEAICEQKRRRVVWAKTHLKWTVSKWKSGQTSPNLTFLLEITYAVSSELKRMETFQHVISIQLKKQHLWWYGGGGGYFSRTMQNHLLQLLQLHGFIVQESGAELACLQSRSFTYWEHLVHH